MEKYEELKSLYSDCTLCPRACHADRYARTGFCGAGAGIRLARAGLHFWEEPCLTGGHTHGAGAIFFSHCTLKCVFCQNHEISSGGFGRDVSTERLSGIMLRLRDEGAACIDLVTATHYIPSVVAALDLIRPRLDIPVVFNCSGYESAEALRLLDGYIDIYLPDLKYYSDALAVRYSSAPRYFETSAAAIREMLRQTGKPVFSPELTMKKGVIIRHMVLPGCRQDSIRLLDALAGELGTDGYLLSLLSQYTPFYRAAAPEAAFPELGRRVTSFEYDSVVRHALELGFDGYLQEKSSAKEEYTPAFDLSGL